MNAICYKNTKFPLVDIRSITQFPYGYAYESDGFYWHIYGGETSFYTLQAGHLVREKKHSDSDLESWVIERFGAKDIQHMNNEVGYVTKGIWRPGLGYDIQQALDYDEYERKSSELALKILLEKLSELFEYIEPDGICLNTYSHKTRELLILACTEVENQWLSILRKSDSDKDYNKCTTNDYVKLCNKAFLHEYQIKFKNYKNIEIITPFRNWNVEKPTESLSWYKAYNQTKHDRDTYFSEAKLEHVLSAIAANLVMHCVRFGPFDLFNSNTTLSGGINQMVEGCLQNCDIRTFYIPLIKIPENQGEDLIMYDPFFENQIQPWLQYSLVF